MKNLFCKTILMLSAGSAVMTLGGCDDGNDGAGNKFKSELIGSYQPTYVEVPTASGGETNKMYLTLTATWADPDNIPSVDASFMMNMPAGSLQLPLSDVLPWIEGVAANFVHKGLVRVDLKNDGTFGAQYHDVIFSDNILADLMSSEGPVFADEITTFPGEGSAAVLPAGALSYYTQDGKVFFAVSKEFLTQVGQQQGIEGLTAIIEELVQNNPALNIVSTETYFALPLKYAIENGVVKVYVDRAMMLPYKELITGLLGSLLDPDAIGGIDVAEMIEKLLDNTSNAEIAIRLSRI